VTLTWTDTTLMQLQVFLASNHEGWVTSGDVNRLDLSAPYLSPATAYLIRVANMTSGSQATPFAVTLTRRD